MISRLEVIPGPGTLARFGEVVVWAAPQASGSLVTFLVESARNVGGAAQGGSRITDHIAAVLQGRDPEPGVAFVALGPSARGTAVLLHGAAQAWDGRSWLVPQPAPGWLRTEVAGHQSMAVTAHGAPPPAPAASSDLQAGVVPAAGFALVAGAGEAATTAMATVARTSGAAPPAETVAAPAPDGPGLSRSAPGGFDSLPTVIGGGELTEALAQVRDGRDQPGTGADEGTTVLRPDEGTTVLRPDEDAAAEEATTLPPEAAAEATTTLPPVADEDEVSTGSPDGGAGPDELTTALPPEVGEEEVTAAVAPTVTAPAPEAEAGAAEATTAVPPAPGGPATGEPLGSEPSPGTPATGEPLGSEPSPGGPPALPPGTTSFEGTGPLPALPAVRRPPEEAPGQPVVAGIHCPVGHFNHPATPACVTCGRPVDRGSGQVSGPRPILGVLLVDDGTVLRLDRSYLLGAAPDADPTVTGGRARPFALPPDPGLGPVHAEIRLTGWTVSVIDRGSPHPTLLLPPGASSWEALRPFITTALRPGTHIAAGSHVLTMVSPWPLGTPLTGA